MKERIKEIMDRENLTPSAFADQLGIGRAVVSHILNGRNNPSLEVITKILETFKNVDPTWLLFGKGSLDQSDMAKSMSKSGYGDLFTDWTSKDNVPEKQLIVSSAEEQNRKIAVLNEQNLPLEVKLPTKSKQISKIIIYFDDNSFQVFKPSSDSL